MPVAIPFLVGAAVVGTGASIYYGNKAAKAQERAADQQKQQSDLQAARQRREAIRQARIQAATTKQTSSNQGVGTSSAAEGGLASIFSQLNSNLSFLDQYKAFGDQAAIEIGKASRYGRYANIAQGAADLAMTAASSGVFKASPGGGPGVDTITAASREMGFG